MSSKHFSRVESPSILRDIPSFLAVRTSDFAPAAGVPLVPEAVVGVVAGADAVDCFHT